MRHVVLFAISHTLYCTSFQAGRPITLVRADPLEMRRAILNPLAMGSRGRYVIVTGVQVPKFPPCLFFVFQWIEAAPGFCGGSPCCTATARGSFHGGGPTTDAEPAEASALQGVVQSGH